MSNKGDSGDLAVGRLSVVVVTVMVVMIVVEEAEKNLKTRGLKAVVLKRFGPRGGQHSMRKVIQIILVLVRMFFYCQVFTSVREVDPTKSSRSLSRHCKTQRETGECCRNL